MPHTEELSEDLPSRIDLYEAGQGSKSISESLDVHVSTVRDCPQMAKVQHCCYPPSVLSSCKEDRKRMLSVVKNPRVSAEDWQKSHAHANIVVHKSTVSKLAKCSVVRWNQNGVVWAEHRWKHLLIYQPLLKQKTHWNQDLFHKGDLAKRWAAHVTGTVTRGWSRVKSAGAATKQQTAI